MAKQPIGRSPRRVDIQNEEKDLTRPWGLYFEQIRSNLYDIRDLSLTINPSSVGSNTTTELSFSSNDIATDDTILSVQKPSHTAGLVIGNARAGTDQVHITFGNVTASSINPPEEDYIVTVLKR